MKIRNQPLSYAKRIDHSQTVVRAGKAENCKGPLFSLIALLLFTQSSSFHTQIVWTYAASTTLDTLHYRLHHLEGGEALVSTSFTAPGTAENAVLRAGEATSLTIFFGGRTRAGLPCNSDSILHIVSLTICDCEPYLNAAAAGSRALCACASTVTL